VLGDDERRALGSGRARRLRLAGAGRRCAQGEDGGAAGGENGKVDARLLAQLSRRDLVPAVWLPSLDDRALRERLRRRMHLVRQRGYIELFVEAVSNADWSDPEQANATVVGRMKEYEPSDELQFLMELSIEPIAAKLALLTPSA
jgi:hypothetical protein